MPTDEYRYFITAYSCRSFSEAARKSSISSQGIGKAIRGLEQKFGVQLFERTTRGIVPTEIASKLYPILCSIVSKEDELECLIANSQHDSNRQVLIGRDSRLGDAIKYGVEEYCRSHDIEIELLLTRDSEEQQAELFVREHYDFRFLSVELDTLPELPREPLTMLHYLPVVNSKSRLAALGTISVDDLRDRTILVESVHYTPMCLLAKMCQERGFKPKFRAVDKTYIWDLLSRSCEDRLAFIRTNEVDSYPWNSSTYSTLEMTPPLKTKIVLQTSHESISEDLLNCIRKSLATHDFE